MDRKSKILLSILIIIIVGSVGYTFYKTVILGDFEVIFEDFEIEDDEEDLMLTSDDEVETDSVDIQIDIE